MNAVRRRIPDRGFAFVVDLDLQDAVAAIEAGMRVRMGISFQIGHTTLPKFS